MAPGNDITRRRALIAGGGTLAFGGGVAYFASGTDEPSEQTSSGADRDASALEETERGAIGAERDGDDDGSDEDADADESDDDADDEEDGTTGYGIDLEGRPVAGDPDAPVDVYYWTEYMCSFCKRFESETFPRLVSEYVDTGQVRLVVLGYPILDEYSMSAMLWSRCVWRQVEADDPGAFWEWHRAVFDAQSTDGHDWADDETFAEITDRIEGVPLADVERCRESHRDQLTQSIEADLEAGRDADIQGTPGFVMYNREADVATRVVGAQPYENFEEALEDVLSR